MQRDFRKDGECMIFDELVTTTHSLDDLKRKIDLKNNKALQENTDNRYRVLLASTESFVSTIDYLYSDIKVERNTDILSATSEKGVDKTILEYNWGHYKYIRGY